MAFRFFGTPLKVLVCATKVFPVLFLV